MYLHGGNGLPQLELFGTSVQMYAYPATSLGSGSTWYIVDSTTSPPKITDIYKWTGSAWAQL